MILPRTKRAIYVVLLCVALFASTFSIYNQFASDSTAADLAGQVASLCHNNPEYAKSQGINCQQAKEVEQGTVSIQGPKGDRGEVGPQGPKGDLGPAGTPGSSIQGPPGLVGPSGVKGDPGTPGRDGSSVTGPQGPQGEIGPQGPKGDRGADGQPGENGKDAPTPESQRFEQAESGCELQTTYSDGRVLSASAPEVMCI